MLKNLTEITSEIISSEPYKMVLSNPRDNSTEYKKVVIQNKCIGSGRMYQIEKYTQTQVFHTNIESEDLRAKLQSYMESYKQVNVWFEHAEWEIKINRNLDCTVSKRESNVKIKPVGNNREKTYILAEGDNIPVFTELGIFTKEYKVVKSMYDKFKQINRFTELVDDALKNYTKDEINIIDFGCGKSYLTFILYYYLVEKRKIKANIIGLDLKKDVIAKCNALTKKFGYDSLRFEVGDINGYKAEFDVDMVVTLHACDTATDYALLNAINWKASVILSVPCCQHEINKQIQTQKLSALTKYGIIKERTSALITDAIRGCVLEYAGYKTDMVEFVDIEHSPKNIMIRARRVNLPQKKREAALEEAKMLAAEFDCNQTLMKNYVN